MEVSAILILVLLELVVQVEAWAVIVVLHVWIRAASRRLVVLHREVRLSTRFNFLLPLRLERFAHNAIDRLLVELAATHVTRA